MRSRSRPRWSRLLLVVAWSVVAGYSVAALGGRVWVGVVAGLALLGLSMWTDADTARGGTAGRSDRFLGPRGRHLP